MELDSGHDWKDHHRHHCVRLYPPELSCFLWELEFRKIDFCPWSLRGARKRGDGMFKLRFMKMVVLPENRGGV